MEGAMKMEDRIARLERILAEDEPIRRLEHKSIRITEIILLYAVLAVPVIWTLFEVASFVANRLESFKHSTRF